MFAKCIAIICLLAVGLHTMPALGAYYYYSEGTSSVQAADYSGSTTVNKGRAGSFTLVNNGPDKVKIIIPRKSLDDYMTDQGINEVTITADLTEEWVAPVTGEGYYRLNFTFGPSGAFFTPDKLEVELIGDYNAGSTQTLMYDENGEALEASGTGNADKVTYYVPHFSSYYYDDYDY